MSMSTGYYRMELFFKSIGYFILLVIILLKEVGSERQGESNLHLICQKTPSPQYQPIDRKERNGQKVEDEKGSSSLSQ